MLADLGMRGIPTIGKAEALKEKHQLAAELSTRLPTPSIALRLRVDVLDDVREFEATRGLSAKTTRTRSREKKKTKGGSDEAA
jgi:hypothetical protein